ncbi:MAG: hypothetical protein M1830_009379 [Pleopsidium flavum]|nr:MAG: hypothetical protein M1830_009379 [Pleopsidium flavum]
MEVGFTVNAGPLSQISVHLISLQTAVQLATGAWGWWRGPQRIQSLQQTLEAVNAALVPAHTFLRQRYTAFRNDHGCVYGAAFDASRKLVRMPLPRASTALSEDAGIDCLRALILGLSCFMDEHQIYGLLKELLPQYLLHFEQDEHPPRLDGACLTATLHFISAVLREEVVDKIRDKLFDTIDSQLPRVTGASRSELLASQHTEVCHISGVLRWIFEPAYKFKGSRKPVYLTRSLRVWALALVLAELGFDVEAARLAVKSSYGGQEDGISLGESHLGIPEVFLVLAQGWPTDPSAYRSLPTADKSLLQAPARVVPIRAIPALAYAEFVEKITISASHLQEAFTASFCHVHSYLRRQQWICRATNLGGVESGEIHADEDDINIVLTGSLAEIFAIWTDLRDEDRGMTHRWLQARAHPRLLLKPLIAKFGAIEGRTDQEAVIQIALLAWLLAVVTLSVRQTGVEDPLDLNYAYCDPFTKTYNVPERCEPVRILEPSRKHIPYLLLYQRVRSAFRQLSNLAALYGLPGAPIADRSLLWGFRQGWEGMIMDNLNVAGGRSPATGLILDTFGIQRNGLAIISDFVINPTMRPSSMLIYHVQRGQLLDLPLKNDYIASGKPSRLRGLMLKAADITISSESDVWAPPAPIDWLRWDVEPCWETDVQTCCFNYRIGGIPQFQIGIQELFEGIRDFGLNSVICSDHDDHKASQCHWDVMFHPPLEHLPSSLSEHRLEYMRGPTWMQLQLVDMISQGQLDVCDIEGHTKRSSVNWLVQVGENEMLAMLALACRISHSFTPHIRIITDCIPAGLEKAKQLGWPEQRVMLIVRSRNSGK